MRETPSPPAITTTALSCRFGRRTAVDRLDLEVHPGEVVGLVGPNGAGKTTTLKMLLGLQAKTAGEAKVLGHDPTRAGVAIRRRVGHVAEDAPFYDWMTVAETLWFVARFHPTWDAALERELVERLELPRERRTGELSRGERAKLALACATAFRPEALLLDDPTTGLDPLARRQFLAEVIEVAAQGGRAVLFSSQDIDEVERLADRIVLLSHGRKVLDLPVEEVKARVREVVATFPGAPPAGLPASLSAEVGEATVRLVVDAEPAAVAAALRRLGATSVEERPLSLEDACIAYFRAGGRSRS